MRVENPIFIIGTGRCGSTVLHHVFSLHPNTAWLSRLCVIKPHRPEANRLALRALDLPFASRILKKLIYPVEAYPFWDHHSPGFSEPCRDLDAQDATPKVRQALPGVMAQMLTPTRHRLLIKITGWPRATFLKAIFPDARFIHIHRDGRAVANSWLNVRWWSGWRGPSNWRWGELEPAQREKWEKHGRSFVALAAIEWEILMAASERAKKAISTDNWLEIGYEALCQKPEQTLRRAAAFAKLGWTPRFEASVRQWQFKSANQKWRRQLSDAQQEILQTCLATVLPKYGYHD